MNNFGFGVLPLCAVFLALGVAGGCARDGPVEISRSERITVLTGDRQSQLAGVPLGERLAVRVTNGGRDAAQPGARVRFRAPGGAPGRVRFDDSVAVTDQSGVASVQLTLLHPRDTLQVEARLAAAPWVVATFTAYSGEAVRVTGVRPTAARAGDTVAIETDVPVPAAARVRFGAQLVAAVVGAGAVRAVVPACLPPGEVAVALDLGGAATNAQPLVVTGSRRHLTLEPYEYTQVNADVLATCVSLEGRGNTYLLTAQFASVPGDPEATTEWRLGADGGTAIALTAGGAGVVRSERLAPARGARDAFDAFLRLQERDVARQAGGAASLSVPRGPGRAVTPPAVGSLREFSVVAATDGSRFARVTARVRYVGERIVAYADTTDNVFATDQLTALVRLMDRDLYGAAVQAFGTVPDVDGDGRLVVLFSPVVNALARANDCLFRGYVKGFFYPPDQIERRPGSNGAEVFYAFVPDPAGKYSCPHTEAEVVRALQPEFLHEMQHLISFNARLLARGGALEEPWLGEALSHVAEELGARLFEARYPRPLGRSTPEQIFPDSAGPFIAPLLLNAYIFLNRTLQHSLTAYVGAGSLEEHGASWLFGRWLGAQAGDGALRRLVQSGRTGVANVEEVLGEPFARLFGDFTLALFADSLPGIPRTAVPSRLRFGDRNVRQLMAREATIAGFAEPFPITTFLLRPGGALRSSMRAGTMIYAILPTDASTSAVGLSFASPGLTPFAASLGAQVGILRLPP